MLVCKILHSAAQIIVSKIAWQAGLLSSAVNQLPGGLYIPACGNTTAARLVLVTVMSV